jgi:hypothetical protein
MKYLQLDPTIQGAEDMEDCAGTTELLVHKLAKLDNQLAKLSANETTQQAELLLEYGMTCLELEKNFEAWQVGKQAFELFANTENWEGAVQACNVMFSAGQPDSLVALGNGVWLAVTFPIDPELSALMLEHIVEETPDDSDGGAIAAVTACYLVDLRATGTDRENLLFFTNQLLAKVARRHSQVEHQADFDSWIHKLALDSPDEFLMRLAQILEIMVQHDWWIDREALRAKLPF